jgi:hypothetical protein
MDDAQIANMRRAASRQPRGLARCGSERASHWRRLMLCAVAPALTVVFGREAS